jgi:23S rRNA (cytidine1920-2'-O)/16S rRNA (cytidine1409-2'-O)-methyltransferase
VVNQLKRPRAQAIICSLKAPKQRLDTLLVARGCFDSREKAQRAIMAGEVIVAGHRADKPGSQVAQDADIIVKEGPRYVSRGGLKLEAALEAFAIDPTGAICLDIGASTGGFTDCLLQHGASKVYAIDVGHSQLDWKIRSDPRVVVREKLNARYLTHADMPEQASICTIDVSFISLSLILPPAFEVLTPTSVIVALIKPQFELGKNEVGKGGIVRDAAGHEAAVAKVREFVTAKLGRKWEGVIESPILGGEGNKEFLACLRP